MEILSLSVSSVFIIFLVKKIVYDIFFPEYCVRKRWELIEKYGYYKLAQKAAAYTAFTIFFFLFAHMFAKYSSVWLILAIICTVALLISLFIVSRKEYRDSKKIRTIPDEIDGEIKGRRFSSILYIVILILWVLSWKHLLE